MGSVCHMVLCSRVRHNKTIAFHKDNLNKLLLTVFIGTCLDIYRITIMCHLDLQCVMFSQQYYCVLLLSEHSRSLVLGEVKHLELIWPSVNKDYHDFMTLCWASFSFRFQPRKLAKVMFIRPTHDSWWAAGWVGLTWGLSQSQINKQRSFGCKDNFLIKNPTLKHYVNNTLSLFTLIRVSIPTFFPFLVPLVLSPSSH